MSVLKTGRPEVIGWPKTAENQQKTLQFQPLKTACTIGIALKTVNPQWKSVKSLKYNKICSKSGK